MYKVKQYADGTLEILKARLVIQGDIQKEWVDFNKTLFLVVMMTTIRCLWAIAAKKKWDIFQFDMNNAFLQGNLQKEVYMRFPPGLNPPKPNMACHLKKSLYGFKQASRQWYARLVGALNFKGMEVLKEEQGIILSQRKYTLDLLNEFDVSHLPPAPSPMNPTVKFLGKSTSHMSDPSLYRHLIGKINYLTHTRPDLCFVVLTLSYYMQQPSLYHYKAGLPFPNYALGTACKAENVTMLMSRRMMIFEKMGFCGDLDFFPAPLKEVELEVVASQNQIEPDSVVDDDYSDKEIDVNEPNFDVHDQFYLLSLYSMVICSLIF
ncbi:hypothetical protein FXO37_20309 [Capsicum annuum]|nr:hypothetical protein FXO37_20309 [Capsicum annuum]